MSMPSTRAAAAGPNLILCLLLPFAAGYFLSYLYRTVNAILGPVIAVELGLPDNALGLLTSAYFLAFGQPRFRWGCCLIATVPVVWKLFYWQWLRAVRLFLRWRKACSG